MSDQAIEQSPESRLEAMLGDIQDLPEKEGPPQAEDESEETETDAVDETEVEASETETDSDDETLESHDETEEDSDEEQPIQQVTLKVNGEEIEKPLDEVVALAQQGLDYTKKTQDVAADRKELEKLQSQFNEATQQFQQQQQLNNLLIEDVAKVTALDQQLAQYQNVDWNQLSDSDFVEAQKLFFQYNQLQQQRTEVVSQFEVKRQEALDKQQKMIADQVAKGKEQLAREIPNWSQQTTQEVIASSKDYGFTDDELNAVIDPRYVRVLHDAMQWRKLKNKNSVIKKKIASAKPVVKPGSKDPKQAAHSRHKKLREQLRQSGSAELASKLIEDMI